MKHVWTLYFIVMVGILQICIGKECTSQGKFPNDQEDSCVGYTMCLIGGAGRFAQLNLTCPAGFIFNHIDARCTNVTGYQCEPQYNCTQIGNFQHPVNQDCTSYIACVEGFNDIITARSIDCPANHTFSPTEQSCVFESEFKCSYIELELRVDNPESSFAGPTVNPLPLSAILIYLLSVAVL